MNWGDRENAKENYIVQAFGVLKFGMIVVKHSAQYKTSSKYYTSHVFLWSFMRLASPDLHVDPFLFLCGILHVLIMDLKRVNRLQKLFEVQFVYIVGLKLYIKLFKRNSRVISCDLLTPKTICLEITYFSLNRFIKDSLFANGKICN